MEMLARELIKGICPMSGRRLGAGYADISTGSLIMRMNLRAALSLGSTATVFIETRHRRNKGLQTIAHIFYIQRKESLVKADS
jgi:hypothetical protein